MRSLIALSVLFAACGGTPAPGTTEEAPAADAAYVLTDADEAILAKADAHDGTEDHVVSECAVCGLGMPGDAAQSVTVGAYEVHMCSETCKSHFESNTASTIERIGEIVN